jgi:hypothetical protein
MRAPGQSVEYPNAEGRMLMKVRPRMFVVGACGMHMHMDVLLAVMLVVVQMNALAQHFSQTPDSNPEEHHAHKSLSPRG